MDDVQFYALFTSISVKSRRWVGENEKKNVCNETPFVIENIPASGEIRIRDRHISRPALNLLRYRGSITELILVIQ